MKFILQRYSDNRKSTLGLLFYVTPDARCERLTLQSYTLEDEYRDEKVSKETRIPAGTYELGLQPVDTPMTIRYQQKYTWFKKHIEIKSVPGFKGIYIHVGNNDGDTEGCILLGDSADNNVISEGMIQNSTAAFKRFYVSIYDHLAAGKKATIEIRDESFLLK